MTIHIGMEWNEDNVALPCCVSSNGMLQTADIAYSIDGLNFSYVLRDLRMLLSGAGH